MSDDCSNKNGGETGERTESEYGTGKDSGITSLDEIFECLRHPKRRFVLYHLRECEVLTVDELARQVAAWEGEVPPEEVEPDTRKRAATNLIHIHLPKLSDTMFIEYDQRSKTLRYTEPPELLDEVLNLIGQFEDEARK